MGCFLKCSLPWLCWLFLIINGGYRSLAVGKRPNFIIFMADDMGYGDLSSYGHPSQEFGAIDQLAAEGMRFTHWYSADSLCTPSRAALLTGRLPVRLGITGGFRIFIPPNPHGLPHEEITLAEALKDSGYNTGIVGKWHLGINAVNHTDGSYLPHHHGFNYVGTILPFTLVWECDTSKVHMKRPERHRCILYQNTSIIQQPIDFSNLTSRFISDARTFLYDNVDHPFFLYFSFAQTHTPMFNHPEFAKKSRRGPYGDQINEMAWGVQEIMTTLKTLGLDSNTLVVFLSDHGPHIELCNEGGDAGMLKGGKFSFYEGGIRVPSIARWPSAITPGTVSHDVISTMDLFPTILELAGIPLPDRLLDGHSISKILFQKENKSHQILYYYHESFIAAVRYKNFKIHFMAMPLPSDKYVQRFCPDGNPEKNVMPSSSHFQHLPPGLPLVYNVETDPGERYPLNPRNYSDLLNEISEKLKDHRMTLDSSKESLLGMQYFTYDVVPCCNPPYCFCNYPGKY